MAGPGEDDGRLRRGGAPDAHAVAGGGEGGVEPVAQREFEGLPGLEGDPPLRVVGVGGAPEEGLAGGGVQEGGVDLGLVDAEGRAVGVEGEGEDVGPRDGVAEVVLLYKFLQADVVQRDALALGGFQICDGKAVVLPEFNGRRIAVGVQFLDLIVEADGHFRRGGQAVILLGPVVFP